MSDHSSDTVLTAGDIRRQLERYRVLTKEIDEKEIEKGIIADWLEAVTKLIGKDRMAEITGFLERENSESGELTNKPKSGRPAFTDFVEDYVNSAGEGVDYERLREACWNSPMRETMERTDKTFHGAISKLVVRKRIVRHKERLYSHDAYRAHAEKVAKGEIKDDFPEKSVKHSPMADAITRYVGRHSQGVRSRDIVTFVGDIPEFSEVVNRNKTNVYNVISRMLARHVIRKEGVLYFPNSEKRNSDTQ